MTPIQIDDGAGLVVDLIDYGARIVQINFNDQKLACAYDSLDDYATDPFYLGATIGPITNRIHRGQFTIGGQHYQIPRNEGENTLHSGGRGFDKEIWNVKSASRDSVEFQLNFDLRKAGMSGALEVTAVYSVNKGVLRVEYASRSDTDTYVNLTNHVYLNLSGENRSITDHDFEILADSFVNVDAENIPTGEITSLNRPFIYNIAGESEYSEFSGSIDHHFNVGDAKSRALRPLLNAWSSSSGIRLQVLGNSPGFHFYTGESLSAPFAESGGFCVETQFAPDAVNQPNFYAPVLKSGETLQQISEYQFTL